MWALVFAGASFTQLNNMQLTPIDLAQQAHHPNSCNKLCVWIQASIPDFADVLRQAPCRFAREEERQWQSEWDEWKENMWSNLTRAIEGEGSDDTGARSWNVLDDLVLPDSNTGTNCALPS